MKYEKGDIWKFANCISFPSELNLIVVTTNLVVKNNDEAVMGAGIAKEAAIKYPSLPKNLGKHIKECGENLFLFKDIICLPTKRDWRDGSHIDLIESGCKQLVLTSQILNTFLPTNIYLPKLGCGLGGLNWERDVRPMVDAYLIGDKFILVEKS